MFNINKEELLQWIKVEVLQWIEEALRNYTNEVLQWAGTLCFMAMYILMSLNMYPWNIVAGMMGSACYLAWTVRVANKPQMVVNVVGIAVCAGGLFKAFG